MLYPVFIKISIYTTRKGTQGNVGREEDDP